MELLEGICSRRSFRAFKATPVPAETLERILEAAGRSPSYTNTQPWEVAVVCGEKRDELSNILYQLAKSGAPSTSGLPHPPSWPPEMEARARDYGARRLEAAGVAREDAQARKELSLMNYRFFGAPCALFLFMDKNLSGWSLFDMGLFAQSVALAAHSFGVGTCLQASLGGYPDAVRRFLGIPETKTLVLGMSLGYPDHDVPVNSYRSSRMELKDFVRWYG